jgi:hypothetical protein
LVCQGLLEDSGDGKGELGVGKSRMCSEEIEETAHENSLRFLKAESCGVVFKDVDKTVVVQCVGVDAEPLLEQQIRNLRVEV